MTALTAYLFYGSGLGYFYDGLVEMRSSANAIWHLASVTDIDVVSDQRKRAQ